MAFNSNPSSLQKRVCCSSFTWGQGYLYLISCHYMLKIFPLLLYKFTLAHRDGQGLLGLPISLESGSPDHIGDSFVQ